MNRLQKIVDKTSYSAACAACKAAKDVGLNNESDVALRTGPLFLLVGCAVVALGFHGIEDADIAAVMLLVGAIFGLVGPIVTLVGVWAKLTGGPRRFDFLVPTEAGLEYHAHRENPVAHINLLAKGKWHDAAIVLELEGERTRCTLLRVGFAAPSWKLSRVSGNAIIHMSDEYGCSIDTSPLECMRILLAYIGSVGRIVDECLDEVRNDHRVGVLSRGLVAIGLLTGPDRKFSITRLGPSGRIVHERVRQTLAAAGDDVDPAIEGMAEEDAIKIRDAFKESHGKAL